MVQCWREAFWSAATRPPRCSRPIVVESLSRRRDNASITIGREQSCGLVVADQKASRQHCTIDRRRDKWVLKDHSTNGTYVTAEGDSEMLLQREELTLREHGWFAFGQPRAGSTEVVEYFCG